MFRSKNHRIFILGAYFIICWVIFGFVVTHPGTPTMFAIQKLTTDNVKRTTLKKIYTAEIGVQEATRHNDGPRVQEYLRYVNKNGNFSYCAAFACWAMAKAGVNNPKNGWAPALLPQKRVVWARDNRGDAINRVSTVPQTGDVFGIYFSELKRIAHCGFVDRWDDTWCITVEANTTNPIRAGPSTEGVYRKKRPVKTIYQVANWVDPPGSQPTSKVSANRITNKNTKK